MKQELVADYLTPLRALYSIENVVEKPAPPAVKTSPLFSLPLELCTYHPDLVGKVCRPVTDADCADLPLLVAEMTEFCRKHDGVGLAAPQVGVYIKLAIVLHRSPNAKVLVNPEIVNLAGRDLLEDEGCLSLPGIPPRYEPFDYPTARVWRSEIVTVKAGTLDNPNAEKITKYKGFTGRVVQHEIDHLKGVFFIDRCQAPARAAVLGRYGRYLRERQEAEFRGQ